MAHFWTASHEDCPICSKPLFVEVCEDKSCRQCLGALAGYKCTSCDWSGDIEDLRDAQPKGEA